MQFHSIVVSEPAALLCGLVAGALGFFGARALQADPGTCTVVGNAVAAGATFVVGGTVNIALLDVLGALVFRPLTGYGTPYLLERRLG